MFNTTKAIATVSIAAALSVAATAGNPSQSNVDANGVQTMEVSYADLDLNTSQGMETLERRIDSAVRQVCGYNTGRQTLERLRNYRDCSSAATSTALAAINTSDAPRVAVRTAQANPKPLSVVRTFGTSLSLA